MYYSADIGVIGGSGLYELYPDVKKIEVDTPYGKPSDEISLVKVGEKTIAFLPRHHKDHILNPSEINYRANIYAMKMLGIKALISPCCVGSLRFEMKPGDFVVTDQFINMTSGRKDTFFEKPKVNHLSSAHPYDQNLREKAIASAKECGISVHDGGTVVVINGPRFSTVAESRMFAMMGADVVNMTQYPEGYLCLEQEIPVVNIALITDYDAGLEDHPEIKAVTNEDVVRVLHENSEKVKKLIFNLIEKIEG
ncbi:MAG: 5-methylthioadenosine phosphorylase [Eubacteriaceae bacterium]|jgi:5'-methylthioadenosine phosphorylase|nr:5-methylthioadenosine phosphorylase [Eubacteriaceae bacterium]MDK2904956.1 5-methylthioadenosine phosphorylase [Eubacteriaceae bacterium]MDK2937033.1 5-methylthioadenosine phosphorylase [Eubacteriaceae bacterium]MDN5307421.1 5-methylthioadenosine phosphorylase [Eubacteriaceae bacterium]